MSRFPLPTTHSLGLMPLAAVKWINWSARRWVMASNALLNLRDDSCSDARMHTPSERESMERATRELDAQIRAVIDKDPPKFAPRKESVSAGG